MESIWDLLLKDEKEEQEQSITSPVFYINLSYSEIKKRDIAYQIYSEYVDDTFWICSNYKMVEQIRKDDPESVVYHIDEIVRINKLKPDIKGLKSIHYAKKVFGQSKLVEINKKKH